MKKLYSLLALGMLTMPALAQEEEDVTHYIANPGFDEDITWQTDGSTKEIVDKSISISSRTQAWISEDGSVYSHAKTTAEGGTNWNRKDGVEYAWNGFFGQIKGWEAWSSAAINKTEWVYFGSISYGTSATAIPIADDGTTYLVAPEKPADYDTEDNKGALYLRAGWGGAATYKQTIKLPCAQYRLDYWIYNTNYEGSKNNTKVQNLCQVKCRKDVFPDEEGFASENWTKHSIEFTPTAEFEIQFGFKSDGGSNSNPFLLIDAIKLYKIGEADVDDLAAADFADAIQAANDSIAEWYADYDGIIEFATDYLMEVEEEASDAESMIEATKKLEAFLEKARALQADIDKLNATFAEAQAYIDAEETYPGLPVFTELVDEFDAYCNEGLYAPEGKDALDYVAEMEKKLRDGINSYITSQEATPENPADYTMYIDNPTFAAQGKWYIGETGGDQNIKTDKTDNEGNPVNCWNAWRNNLDNGSSVSVQQDITGLPNGKYIMAAALNTQDGCITNQHLYAKSSIQTAESPVLSVTGWNPCVWEDLKTSIVIVNDGKLTIGAIGVSDGDVPSNHGGTDTDKRRGWFNMINVTLSYLGKATDEEIAAVVSEKYQGAKEFAESMHLAADKATLAAAIAKAEAENDIDALNAAMAIAQQSETDYNSAINASYKAVSDSLLTEKSEAYKAIAKVPVDAMTDWLNSAEATYTMLPAYYNVTIYYRDNLLPAILKAEEAQAKAGEQGAAYIASAIADVQKALAVYTNDNAVLSAQVTALNEAIALAAKADIAIVAGNDVTGYINNPNIDSEAGWTYNRPKGDKNSTTSQGVDGVGGNRYLDCWQSAAGTTRYTAYQVLEVPNGKYTVSNIMRASGGALEEGGETVYQGAYLFASDKAPVTNEENALTLDPTATNVLAMAVPTATPTAKYGIESEEESVVYTDSYGEIYMAAADRVIASMGLAMQPGYTVYDAAIDKNGGESTCPEGVAESDWAIIGANAGKGRGWFNNSLEIEVTDHVLVIGITCDGVFTAPAGGLAFTGTWFSADNFKLVLNEVGDNTNWGIIPTAIEAVGETAANATIQAIYSVAGARINALQKGINVVKMSNGEVKKIYVK